MVQNIRPHLLNQYHCQLLLSLQLIAAGVNLCGNGWERSSHTYFRWERRSDTYSYFPVGTQFLQRSVTISIRPILVAQQTMPLMNVFIYLRAVLRIKLGPVISAIIRQILSAVLWLHNKIRLAG